MDPSATTDPRLPARIPTALRHECNVVVGYLGNSEEISGAFVVCLTARIKDAVSLPTVPWVDVLHDFLVGVLADLTGLWYRPQDDGEDEVEEVGKGDDAPHRLDKTPAKSHGLSLLSQPSLQRGMDPLPLKPVAVPEVSLKLLICWPLVPPLLKVLPRL